MFLIQGVLIEWLYKTHTHTHTHKIETFCTVLSGSNAMSGTPESNINENRFNIRLADLKYNTDAFTLWKSSGLL